MSAEFQYEECLWPFLSVIILVISTHGVSLKRWSTHHTSHSMNRDHAAEVSVGLGWGLRVVKHCCWPFVSSRQNSCPCLTSDLHKEAGWEELKWWVEIYMKKTWEMSEILCFNIGLVHLMVNLKKWVQRIVLVRCATQWFLSVFHLYIRYTVHSHLTLSLHPLLLEAF